VVDYPSIERASQLHDDPFRALLEDSMGIVYVIPRRGITEEDAYALELLRSRPLAVVQNLRESELLATTSPLERIDLPNVTCPFALPIVPFRLHGGSRLQGADERELLRRGAALLLTHCVPVDELQQVRRLAASARAKLRRELTGRLAGVHRACRQADRER